MSDFAPPTMKSLVLEGRTAKFSVRMNPKPFFGFLALGLLFGLAPLQAVVQKGDAHARFLVLVDCLYLVIMGSLAYVSARSRYELTLDFDQRNIKVVDVRGMDPARAWEGSFDKLDHIELSHHYTGMLHVEFFWKDRKVNRPRAELSSLLGRDVALFDTIAREAGLDLRIDP